MNDTRSSEGAGWLVYAAARRQRTAAVVLPWDRRGDFQRLLRSLASRPDAPPKRLAWRRVKRRTLDFHLALVDALAALPWLRVATLDALDTGGRPLRLRIDDQDQALAKSAPPASSVRVVGRKATVGLQVARLLASALGHDDTDGDTSKAQRELAAAVRSRFARAAAP